MYLVGQEKNKDLIDNGKIDNSTFILIRGPEHYGKTYLVKYIANHYGMHYKLLDNKVDTIRGSVESSDRNNNNCVYHFKDFEKSSPAAKAALLKVAEETPTGTKIIVTTSAYNFLDTLVSRAYNMNIQPYSKENILDYINILSFDETLLNTLINEYKMDITPSILRKYKERQDIEELIELSNFTIDAILKGMKLEDIGTISNKFWSSNDDVDKIKIYLELLESGIVSKVNGSYKYIKAIEKTLYQLNKIAISNYKMLIHNMLMEMVE